MELKELLKEIINLPPEQYKQMREAIVKRLLGEPTKKELVEWIFGDIQNLISLMAIDTSVGKVIDKQKLQLKISDLTSKYELTVQNTNN